MTVRVATVLSARDWEPDLVAHMRSTAGARVVLRAFQPTEIDERVDEIDVVVAGTEVSWITPARLLAWRRSGLGIVGIHPAGDRPAEAMLAQSGIDEVLPDDTPLASIVAAIRFAGSERRPSTGAPAGRCVVVVGNRGAPGCTEIAIAAAWALARRHTTLLLDLDGAPAVAIRLGIPPRPDVVDAVDAVRAAGELDLTPTRSTGGFDVLPGSHRPGTQDLRPSMVDDLLDVALGRYERVIVDRGAPAPDDRVLKRADTAILVVDAGAVGIVRAAATTAEWAGPAPVLVLNRVPRGAEKDVTLAARRWLGLEPALLIPDRPRIRAAALSASPPDRRLRRLVATVIAA